MWEEAGWECKDGCGDVEVFVGEIRKKQACQCSSAAWSSSIPEAASLGHMPPASFSRPKSQLPTAPRAFGLSSEPRALWAGRHELYRFTVAASRQPLVPRTLYVCVCVCMYCVGVLAGPQCRSAAYCRCGRRRLLDTVYAIGVGCVCKNSHSLLVCISHRRPAVEAVLLCTLLLLSLLPALEAI